MDVPLIQHLPLPLRFAAVGVLNTAFGYFAFAAFLLLGTGPLAAIAAAAVASVAFNFETARRIVFRSGAHGRALRFVTVYAFVLALDWVGLRACRSIGIPELAAQAVLTAPLAVISYFGQKMFVFEATAQRAAERI